MRNIFAEKIENKFTAKNIILHAGTNDIPAEDPETVFSKMMHQVEDITLRMPNSKDNHKLMAQLLERSQDQQYHQH